jgi:hypothetical protein
MSKQTATDYLIQEIKNDALVQAKSTKEWNEVFQKAKEMEREQIVEAYQAGDGGAYSLQDTKLWGQEFYNEKYGGNNE